MAPFALCLLSCLANAARATPRLVYQSSTYGIYENLAIRANGEILVTSIGAPGEVTILNPFDSYPQTNLIGGFDFQDTLGIWEPKPEVFYVLSSNVSRETFTAENGTNALWRLDFASADSGTFPKPQKVVNIQQAEFLNGLTGFSSNILLAGDSRKGVVWAIDVLSRTYWLAADDPLMKPNQGGSIGGVYLEGINGLHLRPTHDRRERRLCFTNSQQFIFACMELDESARAKTRARVVAKPAPEQNVTEINWDDFTFDDCGTAWIATEAGFSVQAVTEQGAVSVVAGGANSSLLAYPTSVAFGRTGRDFDTIYVATAVYSDEPGLGPKIVAIDGVRKKTDAACRGGRRPRY